MATTTAAEKRERARSAYDAYVASCPSRQLVERISDKWVLFILSALGAGADCQGEPAPMRYSELSRLIAGVSQKMLTQTLRSLERDGLVTRSVVATVPVTVSYELTDLGISLHKMMVGLKGWAQDHMDDVFANRARYDA